MPVTKFVERDTDCKLEVICKDQAGTAISLTGKTVRLHWQIGDKVFSGDMTATDAANGVAEYTFGTLHESPDEFELIPGEMEWGVRITTDATGKEISSVEVFRCLVRKRIGG